jgi:energy-coupling factor transporter ATP-binding protein EcfA2
MRDEARSETSPFGPARPTLELTTLRANSRLIDVSLEIQHGILNVWFGANGSGKSLMLRAVRAVLLGDYSEFGNGDILLFQATFSIPQNLEVWAKIRDHLDRESLIDDPGEEDEDVLNQQVDRLLTRLEDSILNPSPGVARPQIQLNASSDSPQESWFLVFAKDYEASSEVIELDDGFRAGLWAMFPNPVFIDNNLINALPIWLPKVLTWTDEPYIFPSAFSFDHARRDPVAASVFFEATPRNSDTAHIEVEWNVRVKEKFQELIEELIEVAQRFLPTFVSESWILTYQFSPLTFGNQPIQIKLRSRTGNSNDMIDLTNASEGIKRWVTISLAIASITLWSRRENEFSQHLLFDMWDIPGQAEVSHFYFLIDEPEAHLSLNAISSVATAIESLAPMTTLIATHSPNLIDGLDGMATFRGIHDKQRTRDVETFGLTDFVDLRGFAEVMGLSASEFVLRSGRLLLVEGEHDAIVLTHWFGPELDRHGVYVRKTSGTDHLPAILKSSLINDVSKRAVNRDGFPGD